MSNSNWSASRGSCRRDVKPCLTDAPLLRKQQATLSCISLDIRSWVLWSLSPVKSLQDVAEIRFEGQYACPNPKYHTDRTLDDNLLARRTSVPGRIRSRSYLTCRYCIGNISTRWHCSCGGEEGHKQAARARYISRETLHSQ